MKKSNPYEIPTESRRERSSDANGDTASTSTHSNTSPPDGPLPLAMWAVVRAFAIVGCVLLIGVPISGALEGDASMLVLILSSVFAGMMFFLAGFIALFGLKWSKDLERLRRDHFIHWTYTQAEWDDYIDNETRRGRWFPLILFLCFAGVGWVTAILIAAGGESDAGLVAVILIGIGGGSTAAGVICAMVMRSFTHRQLEKKRRRGGLTLIGSTGVYIGGELWRWRGAGQVVTNIELETEPRLRLQFTFRVNAGETSTDKLVYVPVPAGCDDEARKFMRDYLGDDEDDDSDNQEDDD